MKTAPWKLIAWICTGLVVLAVVSSIYVASTRSTGIKSITVTFVGEEENRDHNIPLFKRKEALPDYTLTVRHARRGQIVLGTKVDQSAQNGLNWELPKIYSLEDITLITLTDKDELISDTLAQVAFPGKQVIENGYQFDYELEQSFKIGLESFWDTAVGRAITWAIGIVALLILLCIFAPVIAAILP